jgi:hypothetical protein
MADFDPTGDFELLLREFEDRPLRSGPDRDLEFAKAGFSKSARIEDWSDDYTTFIHDRCVGELSDSQLAAHGDDAVRFRAFACLALGTLIGRYHTSAISDLGFAQAEALLAGFMYLNLPRLHQLKESQTD